MPCAAAVLPPRKIHLNFAMKAMLFGDLRQFKSYMKVRCSIKIARIARQSVTNLGNYRCVIHSMVWKLFLIACLILCFMCFGDCTLRKSNKQC